MFLFVLHARTDYTFVLLCSEVRGSLPASSHDLVLDTVLVPEFKIIPAVKRAEHPE